MFAGVGGANNVIRAEGAIIRPIIYDAHYDDEVATETEVTAAERRFCVRGSVTRRAAGPRPLCAALVTVVNATAGRNVERHLVDCSSALPAAVINGPKLAEKLTAIANGPAASGTVSPV